MRSPAPATSIGATKSWLAKPVARTIASVGRSTPVASRTPLGVTASTPASISSTLGSVRVGYQSSVSMIRLQPTSSVGVTLRRSSGSEIAASIWRWPTARKSGSSQRCRVSAAAANSWKA